MAQVGWRESNKDVGLIFKRSKKYSNFQHSWGTRDEEWRMARLAIKRIAAAAAEFIDLEMARSKSKKDLSAYPSIHLSIESNGMEETGWPISLKCLLVNKKSTTQVTARKQVALAD